MQTHAQICLQITTENYYCTHSSVLAKLKQLHLFSFVIAFFDPETHSKNENKFYGIIKTARHRLSLYRTLSLLPHAKLVWLCYLLLVANKNGLIQSVGIDLRIIIGSVLHRNVVCRTYIETRLYQC